MLYSYFGVLYMCAAADAAVPLYECYSLAGWLADTAGMWATRRIFVPSAASVTRSGSMFLLLLPYFLFVVVH